MNLFIKEQDLDRSVLEQLLNRKKFEEKFTELFMRLLENDASLFLFVYKRELEAHNQLIEIESLHDFIGEIESIYTKCIEIFNKNSNRIDTPEIKEILQGITEALKSGLDLFPKDEDNMITVERISMISQAISIMKSAIRKSIESYMSGNLSIGFLDLDVRKMIEALLNHVFEANMLQFKELHSAAMKDLNLFDKRVQGRKYMGFVSTVKNHMEVFKSIQPENIEVRDLGTTEMNTFRTILMIVQEIYKKLDTKEQKIFQVVNQKTFSMETIHQSFEVLMGYDQIMDHMMVNEELLDLFITYNNTKQEIISKTITSIADEARKTVMFSMQEIAEESKEFQLLSCQTVQYFKMAEKDLQKLNLGDVPLTEELSKLLLAIVETLQMKYETLKEKEYDYTVSKKENAVAYEKQLIDFCDVLMAKSEAYFEEMLSSSTRPFVAAHESYKKLFHQLLNHNLKFDLAYLKTDLLFEIVTLEELVKFSLPKLSLHEHTHVKEAVKVIQDCYKNIEKVLQKARIETLEPKIHEKFNGKEHEAIMVEKAIDFQKGEIVSVHTKGYTFEGLTVIRANVTAAQ